MFQCLGLGTSETGGCGEDWWHPQCLMGLPRNWKAERTADEAKAERNDNSNGVADKTQDGDDGEDQVPPGFPDEYDFENMICYKCVASNPWIKQYAGTNGFLAPLLRAEPTADALVSRTAGHASATTSDDSMISIGSKKRKALDLVPARSPSPSKRVKTEAVPSAENETSSEKPVGPGPPPKHQSLPPPPEGSFSLFLHEDFRDHLCHCPSCYPNLIPHPQLLEEEEVYEPPLSESSGSEAGPRSGARSQGTGSLLERGEAALSTMDRVRAIEGVMAYNHLKDKVKDFLKPFAESGKVVGAEDVKAYFEKLRGDDAAIREAGVRADKDDGKEDGGKGDHRREQGGY
jgi:E3 ubiquitin-protein ligase UBR7